MKIPNIRLLNQQLLSPLFSQPKELVSWMGAMQAQNYSMVKWACLLYTSPSPRDGLLSRMPSSA